VANVPTDRRAVVRVLLRLGTPYGGAPAARQVAGYTVMIVGEPKPGEWPSTRVGDVEGVVWTTPRQVARVVENLRACEGVIDARKGDD